MTQEISIKGPTIISDLTRYPSENPITVSDEIAEDLRDRGLLLDVEDLDAMKLDELKALAAQEGIDLGEATKKADIIEAIRAGRATAA